MLYTVNDISKYLDMFYPRETAEQWDNCGLQTGVPADAVSGILVALDLREEIINEAKQKGCNMVVTHHPLIYKPLRSLIYDEKGSEGLVYRCVREKISVYSAHTTLDAAARGTAFALANRLELVGAENIHCVKDSKYYNVFELSKEMPANEFLEHVKAKLRLTKMRYVGKKPDTIRKIGIFCGSFDETVKSVYNSNIDILITGDVKYHTAMDMCSWGLFVADVGHYGTELPVLTEIARVLTHRFSDCEVHVTEVNTDPFVYA